MLRIGQILLLIGLLAWSEASRTVNTHLSSTDQARLQKVFLDGLKSNDLQSIYYSALNNNKLTADEKLAACKKIVELYGESKLNEFEKNFYLVATHKELSCTTPVSQNIVIAVESSLSKDAATSHETFYNYFAAKAVGGVTIDDALKTKIARNLQTILKRDDSLTSLGHAFYVAADLGSSGSLIVDRIEDAIVQADEVDGKMLQFEGGLSITALIINGAFKLTTALNKPAPIAADQAVKFATYFLSRRSVQSAKGVSVLIEALKTISQQENIAPICIQIIGNGQLQPESPVVNVKIVDLLGNTFSPQVSSITATVTSNLTPAMPLLTKANLVAKSSDKTVYALDLISAKPSRGLYKVELSADNFKQTFNIKVLGKVKVTLLEIGVGDSDSTSAVKKQTVTFPQTLSTVLNADAQQKVVLKAVLVDEASGKPITVHQAFIRLANKKTNEEIIFVAEQDTSKSYKFDMDVGARSADFGHHSGDFSLEFIVGDASLSNSFNWHLADIQLKFSQEPKATSDNLSIRSPRPEIVHQFRVPEVRPAKFVSDLFTGLCLAPLLFLFICWIKLRANFSNFPFSLSALGFHMGLGAILCLFIVFWLRLDMFDTIRYLLPLALFTFLCGNRLLRSIAARKSSEK